MKIIISGSSGLVGSALHSFLQSSGHDVICLVRNCTKRHSHGIIWDPEKGEIDHGALEGADAIVNLAGDNIANARWTEAKKLAILDSRVKSTKLLNEAIRKLQKPPKVFLSSSAVGFYGDREGEICTEKTPHGKGFLAEVCHSWETAALEPRLNNTRIVLLRFGVILSSKGGALGKMLPAFKCGAGGILGQGTQFMSWIAIEDVLAVIQFTIDNNTIEGPINVVAPFAVTNIEFTKTLGKVLHRPTFFSVPSFMLKMLLGKEMADEFLLSSTRAQPLHLENAGYRFLYPTLEPALEHLLNKNVA